MSNTEIITNKASKKKIYVFAGIALAVILLAVIGIIAYSNAPAVRMQKRLDLGNRYLSEMEYEKAIAEYEAVIEIDPKNVDAYIGLADAYIGLGQSDKAIEVLEKGYDSTNDERLKAMLDELRKSSSSNVSANAQENNAGSDDWKEQFSDLRDLYQEYLDEIHNGYSYRGSGDWAAVFRTVDEIKEAYAPLIARTESLVEYLKTHDISYQEISEYGLPTEYDLRRFYIFTHQFDKSAALQIFSGESADGYITEFDEYNREIYFKLPSGDTHTYTWGDDGCVSSYTAVYMDGEVYNVGTTEEYSFTYDNGRIMSEHVIQTIPEGDRGGIPGTYTTDTTYEYDGNVVTWTYYSGGQVGSICKYEINKYGQGKEISREFPN